MTKPAKPGRPARPRPPALPNVPMPATVKLAIAAMALIVIGSVIRGLAIYYASTGTLRQILIHANAKAKKPKPDYANGKQIITDLHALRIGYLFPAVLTLLVVAFLAYSLRKPRSASNTRWILIVALFFPTGALFGAYSQYGFPQLANVGGWLMTIGSVASIILMFVPQSSSYFAACRDLSMTPERRAAAAARPKLFGPRTTPAARTSATRPAAARPSNTSTGGNKAKSKARNDAEAVARGAELARTRARASKSRRTDV